MADPNKNQTPARSRGTAKRAHPQSKQPKTLGQKVGLASLWALIGVLVLAIAGAGVFFFAYSATPIPDPNRDFQTNVTTVYYNDGKTVLGDFAVQNRVSLDYNEMPQNIKDAIVAAENETFWTDPGISFAGLTRAMWTALDPNQDTVGGSTITQQYVKVLYLTQDKTLQRKLKEIIIALKVGRELPKEKILEGYLNTVYYGRGAYGVQAAAKAYFGIDAKQLSLPQAVALAAIINSPGNLDPARGEKQAADLLERYQYTLNKMVETGKLTEAEKQPIYTKLPDFPEIAKDSRFGGTKGYLLRQVQDEMAKLGYTEAETQGGGLSIITTIDPTMQSAAEQAGQDFAKLAASQRKKDPKSIHPAITSVDVATGGILAQYGGDDYLENNRNWATTPRPTGSTFKPWALVAALRDGFSLNDRFNGNEFTVDGHTVRNGRNYGPVTMIQATTNSINSAYYDIVRQMKDGPTKVMKAANDAGVPKGAGWENYDNIALGAPEVSTMDAANGFATLANGGRRNPVHMVAEVKDQKGSTTYTYQAKNEQTIEADVAQDAIYALTNVTKDGTGWRVSALGHEVAGKTGTRYESDTKRTTASWFVGTTKQISTAVMFVAGRSGSDDLGEYSDGFYGGNFPARTWLQYMKVAMEGQEKLNFPGPSDRKATRKPTYIPKPQPTVTQAQPASTAPAEPTATASESAPVESTAPSSEPSSEPSTQPTAEKTSTAPQPSETAVAPPAAPSEAPTAQATASKAVGKPTQGPKGQTTP